MSSKEQTKKLEQYAELISYRQKEQIPYPQLAQEIGTTIPSIQGMVGVLSKGGKVLDDLAGMGYRVATLPPWVGPTSEELAKGTSQVPHRYLKVPHRCLRPP